jgi:hypothetical protein
MPFLTGWDTAFAGTAGKVARGSGSRKLFCNKLFLRDNSVANADCETNVLIDLRLAAGVEAVGLFESNIFSLFYKHFVNSSLQVLNS